MESNNVTYKRWDSIVKSEQDNREYRGLLLDNGLKVLLVSDPTTDKSAAAIEVNVGRLTKISILLNFLQFKFIWLIQ